MNITPTQSKHARDVLGLSQAAVAKAAKVNRTYLSSWENESKILTDTILIRLHDFYRSQGYQFPDEDDSANDSGLAAVEAPQRQPQHPQARKGPAAHAARRSPVPQGPTPPRSTHHEPVHHEPAGYPHLPEQQPAVVIQREGAVRLPAGTYLYDGWVIPNGVRRGLADQALMEIEENTRVIEQFLNSETMAVSHYDDGWLVSEPWDDSPLEQQSAAAAKAIALMAKNYLLLARIKGDAESLEAIKLLSGCCSDDGASAYEFISLDEDRAGRGNAALVSRLLDDAFDGKSELLAAEYVPVSLQDDD